MKSLLARIQKDISKFQKVVHKESNDLLAKIKQLDLKKNVDYTKKELVQALSAKLKQMEPTYNTLMRELRKNAKKAGVELDKIEKSIKEKAEFAKKNLSSLSKKSSKTKKSANTKATGKKKTRKKTTVSVK